MRMLDKLRRFIRRGKHQSDKSIKVKGNGNRIEIPDDVDHSRVLIHVHGDGNVIEIQSGLDLRGTLHIVVDATNSKILIEKNVLIVSRLEIYMLSNCQDGCIEIGSGTSFWKSTIKNFDSQSSVRIGQDCMFSYDTHVTNTDEHLILWDGFVCNKAKNLDIGNHVWVAYGACVLKNSRIPDGSIIGRSAVVSGKFDEQKSVIVGNPGRVVKTGVDWLRTAVNQVPLSLRK